jgi:hypothetical protein
MSHQAVSAIPCADCTRLWSVRASLALEYQTVLDVVTLTPRDDHAYADWWQALATVSDRLAALERRARTHHGHHFSS